MDCGGREGGVLCEPLEVLALTEGRELHTLVMTNCSRGTLPSCTSSQTERKKTQSQYILSTVEGEPHPPFLR